MKSANIIELNAFQKLFRYFESSILFNHNICVSKDRLVVENVIYFFSAMIYTRNLSKEPDCSLSRKKNEMNKKQQSVIHLLSRIESFGIKSL